ncbi:hypothetical protein QJQ45_022413 [Haematococcus lacustris]|nr:hypothetical protein QJQ45_022413 [Haematococcus lacustris]
MAEESGKDYHSLDVRVESKQLTELTEQKNELLSKVQSLKKELQDWRLKLDTQVKSYRNEITDLRKTLNTEVESLRHEFLDLKTALKTQLELTSGLAPSVVEAEPQLAALKEKISSELNIK